VTKRVAKNRMGRKGKNAFWNPRFKLVDCAIDPATARFSGVFKQNSNEKANEWFSSSTSVTS
jgi:hypothetical protein